MKMNGNNAETRVRDEPPKALFEKFVYVHTYYVEGGALALALRVSRLLSDSSSESITQSVCEYMLNFRCWRVDSNRY